MCKMTKLDEVTSNIPDSSEFLTLSNGKNGMEKNKLEWKKKFCCKLLLKFPPLDNSVHQRLLCAFLDAFNLDLT